MQEFTGLQYLMIDIASHFGLDKKDWNVRLEWTIAHEDELEDLLVKADEPALYYAAVQAYRAVQREELIGYPISLDATSSGLQILACLACDELSAKLCNVISTGHREDAYTNIYMKMCAKLGEQGKILREDVKRAVMTSLYGSEAVPEEVFGEGVLLNTFHQTMEEEACLAWELNKMLLRLWDDNALMTNWVLPDNFHVQIKVMDKIKETFHFLNEPYQVIKKVNKPIKNGRSLGANIVHSLDGMIVREVQRRCNYNVNTIKRVLNAINTTISCYKEDEDAVMVKTLWNHYKESGYLSARILNHINENNIILVDRKVIQELIDSLPEEPFELLTIHDCFRCHPNYGNDLRKQYNIQLAMIAKSDMLNYILTQCLGRKFNLKKDNPDMWKQVLDAEYALS